MVYLAESIRPHPGTYLFHNGNLSSAAVAPGIPEGPIGQSRWR
jgi:hypothetical protein